MNLDVRVETLKGVGKAASVKLEKLGIRTVGDLLHHFPRRYDDFSNIIPIGMMKPGMVTFRGEIVNIASRRARTRRLSITEAVISDGTGTVKAVWFNQPFLVKQHPVGSSVMISGKLEFKNNDLALQAPAIESDSGVSKHTGRIVPIYPETEGLTSKQLRNFIMPLLGLIKLEENLPEEVKTKYKLMDRTKAVIELHAPSSEAALKRARHRMAFEELFFIISASLVIKKEIKSEEAPKIDFKVDVAQDFVKSLHFDLTNAQRQAAWQILQDMSSERPMNRLLEGDVGSGKTVVALLAAVMAVRSGYQAAIMVPTDILARQHSKSIQNILGNIGIQSALLLGRQPAAEKNYTLSLHDALPNRKSVV